MKPTRTDFPFGLGGAGMLAAALLASLLAAAPAQAQSVSLVFDKPAQSVTPGSPVTFFGTIVNKSGAAVSLNGSGFGQLGADFGVVGLMADATPFFNFTPFTLGTLQADSSTGDIALFTVTANTNVTPGVYRNTFNILGGADQSASAPLGGADFVVTASAPAPVPEASTAASLGLLLVSAATFAFKARRRSSPTCGA